MTKIPFDRAKEMVEQEVIPGFPGAPSRTIWNAPVSAKENFLAALAREDYHYIPNVLDLRNMNTRLIPDNIARGSVMDGRPDPCMPNPDGEADAFGVLWVFDEATMGAMEKPGQAPLLEDIDDWQDVIKFPDVNAWDWEGETKLNHEYLSDPNALIISTIFTGFFERLISWMGFEDAAITMIDEDCRESLEALFDRLCDLYIDYVDHMHTYFGTDILEIHDDWGSQIAPFFSEDVLCEVIIPRLKRLCDACHERGVYVRLHSCGRIERLVKHMVAAGVDIWMGQDHNDKLSVVKEYGDKIIVECEAPNVGPDASDEEVWEAARSFVNDYVFPDKPIDLSIYSACINNPALMTEALYVLSREKLDGTL